MKHLAFIILIALFACQQTPKTQTSEIQFETMGTFGTVKIVSDSLEIHQDKIAKDIDSLFIDFNKIFSTYQDSSVISKVNRGQVWYGGYQFERVKISSLVVKNITQNSFNPAIQPLLNYWMNLGAGSVDSFYVDSLSDFISSDIELDTPTVIDPELLMDQEMIVLRPGITLDFSAIAKGYGVDVVAEYLTNLGFANFMVEIGGEVVCRGTNATGDVWRLGIEEPTEEYRAIYEVVALENKAMATSGNYRNFKVLENGQKVVHIINPKTGYPEISNLLSASIIADDCMSADAYATACMVMGVDACYDFILNKPDLECYLIYSDEAGEMQVKYTEAFGEMLVE